MNHRLFIGAAIATLGAAACGSASTVPKTPAPTKAPNQKTVELHDKEGALVGRAILTSVPIAQFSGSTDTSASPAASGKASPSAEISAPSVPTEGTAVKFHIVIDALSPGSHGFHVHAAGKCDPPDFTSAGPHFNPSKALHGRNNPKGPHAGDLGNLPVGGDGKVTVDLIDNLISLDEGKDQSVVGTASGTALVIHAKADDEATDPAGGSGSRIACGVISPGTGAVEATPETSPSPEVSPSPSAEATVKPTVKPKPSATPTPTQTLTPKPATPSPTSSSTTPCPASGLSTPHAPPC